MPYVQNILFLVCALDQLFYVALYLMHFSHGAPPVVSVPVLGPLTWVQLMAALTGPVWAYKNFLVNVVQLWKASKILVGVDLMERTEARKDAERKKLSK
jgi:CDP-diacylglycerol--inositol 3-phosphatidyltransferase